MTPSLWALWGPAALAEPDALAGQDGMAIGPVVPTVFDGNLGAAHRVEGRDEIGMSAGALLLADIPNFYGHIVAGGSLDLSGSLTDSIELYGRLEMVRSDTVLSAITSNYLGPGHTSLGAAWAPMRGERLGAALHGQVVLPTAFGLYRHAWPFGADLGVSMAYAVSERFEVHNDLVALGSAAAGFGPALVRAGANEQLGIGWRPGRAFSWVVDARGVFAYRAPLDHLAAATAFRFSDGKRFGCEATFVVPLVGYERALVTAELRVAARLGALTTGEVGAPTPQ